MSTLRTSPLTTLASLALLLSSSAAASAGLFRGPYDFSLGPYRGGQPWSYFEAYNYFGVSSTAAYSNLAFYNYYWESPYTWGSGSRYPSIFGYPRRPGFYNPINPAYLTPPRARATRRNRLATWRCRRRTKSPAWRRSSTSRCPVSASCGWMAFRWSSWVPTVSSARRLWQRAANMSTP